MMLRTAVAANFLCHGSCSLFQHLNKVFLKDLQVIRNRFQPVCNYWQYPPLLKGLDPNWGSKLHSERRKIKLGVQYQSLREDINYKEIEKQLEPLRAQVKEQGDVVRNLKASGAQEIDIKNQVSILKVRKKELEDKISKLIPTETFDKARMSDLVKRRFFYDTAFTAYQGIAGQHDYGPLGCDIVDNILTEWHRHFVIQERMLKVNCSSLTPEAVLKASGHVDKFVDYVVKDENTGEYFRLDHLIKYYFEKVLSGKKKVSEEEADKIIQKINILDGMNMMELNNIVKEYEIKSPITGNNLTDPMEQNLMFPISIGHSGNIKGFLRPETAQGIFVNFNKLLKHNQNKLPFACAQVGNAFRNEISPNSGLLRVREFILAEIEHFYYPDDKNHSRFSQVSDTKLWLDSACNQMDGEMPKLMSVGEAVREGLVANETLGYYMARIHQFLIKIGINSQKLRFRQHLSSEMAHYACDCWDAECLTSYGWIECVGCADRSAYDLIQHAKATGVDLCVERKLCKPRMLKCLSVVVEKHRLKAAFKKDAKRVQWVLKHMDDEQIQRMVEALQTRGDYEVKRGLTVTREMIQDVKKVERVVFTEKITPSVVEPSFGIDRIFYSLLEHTFRIREDDSRTFFAVPPVVAPVKVSVLPLIDKAEFMPFAQQLADTLTEHSLSVWIEDTTVTVGRRYVRMDEMAIPFAVTIDELTLSSDPHTVTLRERNSTLQVRIPIDKVPETVKRLSEGKLKWEEVMVKWPKVLSQETDE